MGFGRSTGGVARIVEVLHEGSSFIEFVEDLLHPLSIKVTIVIYISNN
jgi:hypothetical protein